MPLILISTNVDSLSASGFGLEFIIFQKCFFCGFSLSHLRETQKHHSANIFDFTNQERARPRIDNFYLFLGCLIFDF